MKLKKTMTIAALVAGTVCAANLAAFAQDSTNATPPAAKAPATQRPRMNFDSIATRLALTDDQKPKVKPIVTDMLQQQNDVRQDKSLSRADQMAKIKTIREDATTKLKDILTPDQLEKWQKMIAGGRRGQGGAPAAGGAATPPQQ